MSNRLLRFGFHDFLNAQPILRSLKKYADEAGFEMIIDVPAGLARKLESGLLDLAMIPSIEYLRKENEYSLIPDLSISSRGAVGTVLLAAKVPLNKIKTLALDERSRTSAALLQLLFGKDFSSDIKFISSPPDPVKMLKDHDAALIIGDQALALQNPGGKLTLFDLSKKWFDQTRKTFVHAVIAISEGVEIPEKSLAVLQKSKAEGLASIDEIARLHADKSDVDVGVCRDYLANKIRYDLGEDEMAGLRHFRDLCAQNGYLSVR